MSDILANVKELISQKKPTWKKGIDYVQYAGPYFSEDEYIAAIETILDGWLVLGKKGLEFEQAFPKLLGKKYGNFVNSGSSANLLAVSALASINKLKKNTKIITPVSGFPTTINPIIQCGFEPVFVDVEIPSLNMNVEQLDTFENDSIIMFAHALGNPVDLDSLYEIAKRKNFTIIEDCCDALESEYNGRKVGSIGQFATSSFYPAHHITTGEGGFVSSDSSSDTLVVRRLRDWGRDCTCGCKEEALSQEGACSNRFSNWLKRLPNEIFDHKYIYSEIGYNLKPIEVQAAIGLAQLKKLNIIKSKRKHNYERLYSIFKKYEEFFYLPVTHKKANVNWFAFPLTIKESAPFSRNHICEYLESHKIQTRPYFAGNILLQPAYSYLANKAKALEYKNATYVTTHTFFLGVSPVVTDEQIDYIEEIITTYFGDL